MYMYERKMRDSAAVDKVSKAVVTAIMCVCGM
jgi:hypothetical protein